MGYGDDNSIPQQEDVKHLVGCLLHILGKGSTNCLVRCASLYTRQLQLALWLGNQSGNIKSKLWKILKSGDS
ncbi:hypothetical protein QYF36_011531 [Acer negundo]|nr:hypothetical protein QYF36_011531 [Acer negundo]